MSKTNTTTNIKQHLDTLESKVDSLGNDIKEIKESIRLLFKQTNTNVGIKKLPNGRTQTADSPGRPAPTKNTKKKTDKKDKPTTQDPQQRPPEKTRNQKFVSAKRESNGTIHAVTQPVKLGSSRFEKSKVKVFKNEKIPNNVKQLLE